MSAKMVVDWGEIAPTQLRIGIVSSLSISRLAYFINQKFDWSFTRMREEKDHILFSGQIEYHFALLRGHHKDLDTPVYLLENQSYSGVGGKNDGASDLFGHQTELWQTKLSKHPRKPDFFVLLEPPEGCLIDLDVWILHLGQIKGVISAFEFTPFKAKEAENFILD